MVCSSLRRMFQSSSMAWTPFSRLFSMLSHYFDKVKGRERFFPARGKFFLRAFQSPFVHFAGPGPKGPFPPAGRCGIIETATHETSRERMAAMRYLSPSDIRQALSYEEMMAAVEEAFLPSLPRASAPWQTAPPSPRGGPPGHHALLCRGICRHQAHRLQPGQRPPGAPSMAPCCSARGTPASQWPLLEGNTLTALRTGAIGGLAARHLAPEGAASAGLVGCGVQGLHQLAFLCQVRPIHTVYLYNHGSKDLGPFCRQLEAMAAPKTFTIELCPDPDTLLTKKRHRGHRHPATAPSLPTTPPPSGGSASSPSAPGDRRCGRFPRPSGRPPRRSFWSSLRLPGERRPVPAPGLRRP